MVLVLGLSLADSDPRTRTIGFARTSAGVGSWAWAFWAGWGGGGGLRPSAFALRGAAASGEGAPREAPVGPAAFGAALALQVEVLRGLGLWRERSREDFRLRGRSRLP